MRFGFARVAHSSVAPVAPLEHVPGHGRIP